MKTVKISYLMEGQHKRYTSLWSVIGSHLTEEAARQDERDYREWNAKRRYKGWLDFRVVKVTETKEEITL